MAKCKQHINRHLASAKAWLTKAEQSFDKEKDVRGELDLFLAQAELEHARKANRSKRLKYKYPLLQQIFALAIAVSIFGVGFWASYLHSGENYLKRDSNLALGGFSLNLQKEQFKDRQSGEDFEKSKKKLSVILQDNDRPLLTSKALQTSNDSSSEKKPALQIEAMELISGKKSESEAMDSQAGTASVAEENAISEQVVKKRQPSLSNTVTVSTGEMRQLIRTAGQSLRN